MNLTILVYSDPIFFPDKFSRWKKIQLRTDLKHTTLHIQSTFLGHLEKQTFDYSQSGKKCYMTRLCGLVIKTTKWTLFLHQPVDTGTVILGRGCVPPLFGMHNVTQVSSDVFPRLFLRSQCVAESPRLVIMSNLK